MNLNISIKELKNPDEINNASDLAWKVFQEYEGPDYTEEGVKEFYKSIRNKDYLSHLYILGAFIQEELIGIIATRNEGSHIALFFVNGKYQRKGIGKQLFQAIKAKCPFNKMTVNSSPYAVQIYHKLGFQDTNTEQIYHGVRFTPMKLLL